MYTLLLITLAATGAFAVPTVKARGGSESGMGMTVAEAGNQCGNGQVVSCCDTSTSSLASGLLSGDLNGILGGSCSPIPLSREFSHHLVKKKTGVNLHKPALVARPLAAPATKPAPSSPSKARDEMFTDLRWVGCAARAEFKTEDGRNRELRTVS
ncbi:uncharacterized protein Z520_02020 [Fonsecaea multimorphosa CBS 102226]|uniref:Hydrophobin n=1 Tax=Fonsecaea multimorphosa CBS 102226 TaxID=1442371 RepID=A0A0D2IXY7_9EURO|nr:uncharacterized protein Z520_02020 [Fonsecaea multimorphosa CBS 102226]KIY01882.1 hypothetical protein Z520_02020 [Fonsecaea multimorphosa CBS 102226]